MGKAWLFDRPCTKHLTKVRQDLVADFLAAARTEANIETAIDVGCAIGDFSSFLEEKGLRAMGVDGRPENVEEARRRFPGIEFRVFDAEDARVKDLGAFDLLLCFGLLYHLENPFRVVRNLCAMTTKIALIESMCPPGARPVLELQDEGDGEDQSLNLVAFYPSEPCLVKMLYRAGFPYVYRFSRLPEHELYFNTPSRKRVRTMLAASKLALACPLLTLASEARNAHGPMDLWLRWPYRYAMHLRSHVGRALRRFGLLR